ncbi:retron Ec67 family RNA-directed DNA polymerase/endonuclease [Novosphingobium sp. fls2-241-R2A-195]|uniref:retron Ec67 family RNA-directed DNA polymerase/endonuclease n=1 Tax=Novosphingobium sp. fls2-241-R2A-195 TaxID=3040296 RepID=UPI00254B15E8|nr:retron Ec67 family RNA-directed DNA polymerase/endonuclease [Novosphingobium sp. fls2-241-R2A-195]
MLDELKKADTIYAIADLLGFQAKNLAYVLYSIPSSEKYTDFCISKKNGGIRTISAPCPQLKLIQKRLSDILYECRKEISLGKSQIRSFGFERGIGTFENASCHRKKRWVFNADISNFFPSFNFGRVRGYFISNNEFNLHQDVATIIAQIACHNNQLPQGSPCSPIIANLICGSLDFRLSRLAKRNRCSFSRYADDLTFSTNEKDFPEQIAKRSDDAQGWVAGDVFEDVIDKAGFSLNPGKNRMSQKNSRQMATGLVTNYIINSPIEERKFCRSSVHRLLNGIALTPKMFCESFGHNCDNTSEKTPNAMASLESRLVNCHQIRDKSDKRDDTKKFYQPNSITATLRDFYFFKYFSRPGRPIIITEGESDIWYLKAGLKSSPHSIQHLCSKGQGNDADILCDFFNFPKLPSKITGLNGGTGNIKIFLEFYHKYLKKLNSIIECRPVVILLDSDDGISKVLSCIKTHFGSDIKIESNKDFHAFGRNMALVKTPVSPANKKTDVEDFLDPSFTKMPIGGLTFTKSENYDRSKNFGKMALGKLLYDNRHTADHTQLHIILNRLSNAIEAI